MSCGHALFRPRLVSLLLVLLVASTGACEREEAPRAEESSQAETVVVDYLEAYNDQDVDRLTEIFAPSLQYGGEESQREDLLDAIRGFWEAFPDMTLDPTHLIADGEWVAVRIRFSGTHEGEFLGYDPTGGLVEATEMMMFRVSDGQIVEYWYEWDELGFYEQLGAVEGPAG